jgi:hypothetical protein
MIVIMHCSYKRHLYVQDVMMRIADFYIMPRQFIQSGSLRCVGFSLINNVYISVLINILYVSGRSS